MSCMKNDIMGGCSSATVGLAGVAMAAAGAGPTFPSGAGNWAAVGSASSSVRIRAGWTDARAVARSKRWSVALNAREIWFAI